MYDSTTATDIPANAEMVAGYVDGTFRWSDADWALFPRASKIRIAINANTNDGHVLDVEPGDAEPWMAPGWIRQRQAAGIARPTIYCDRSELSAVQAACQGLNYDIWLANWNGVPHLAAGTIATQYDHPPTSGGHYDKSLVADRWYPKEKTMNLGDYTAIFKAFYLLFLGRGAEPGGAESWANQAVASGFSSTFDLFLQQAAKERADLTPTHPRELNAAIKAIKLSVTVS
jgi:hypothetical protein